jgi:copper resistance protein B
VAGALLLATAAAADARQAASPPASPPSSTAGQHAGHGQEKPKPAAQGEPVTGVHDQGTPKEPPADRQDLPAFIPRLTDDDRRAAFPDVEGHSVHDRATHYFVLLDQLEWQAQDGSNGLGWGTRGWVGGDINRLWFRAEGETAGGGVEHAEAHLLYGRAFARWWEVVAGVRQDFRPGPQQTWAAVGVQGLAPYWFEVEATAYVGEGGQTAARLEAEYELLLTNRLVLQPLVELNFHGRSNRATGTGAGLSDIEGGLRLRYELRREVAPYVGVTWNRKFGETADYARSAGDAVRDARLVAGLRLWF